jgi:hypothetical protein
MCVAISKGERGGELPDAEDAKVTQRTQKGREKIPKIYKGKFLKVTELT